MRIDYDNFYMELAFNEAFKYMLLTYPNPSVGALILYKDKLVAIEAHQRAGTSHAEVLALVATYEAITKKEIAFNRFNAKEAHNFLLSLPKGFFKDCSLYVTLEPCAHEGKTPSCANLIAKLGLKEVIIANKDPISTHSGGVEILKRANIEVRFSKFNAFSLIEPFIIWQKRAFVVFKLAQSVNGVIGGGYLSSKESLKHTHRLREVVTTLLIGGNTIRVDRPKLNCRFVSSKAPDVVIYSKSKEFDKSIPLFSENRRVEISRDLSFLKEPGLVLVEGGEGMLKAMKDRLDWFMVYLTPKLREKSVSYYVNLDLEFLHKSSLDRDILIWSKKRALSTL